jgi:hypothetical protein
MHETKEVKPIEREKAKQRRQIKKQSGVIQGKTNGNR